MQKFKKIWYGAAAFLLAAPVIASAQISAPSRGSTGLPDLSQGQGLTGFINYVILFILGFAGIVAVLFLIIGGYQYILSGANEESAEQGKKTIQNAVIGIVIIILSYTIVTVIFRSLTGQG